MKKTVFAVLSLFLGMTVSAQTEFGGVVRLDRTVHDFGVISSSGGPVSCEYNVTNISDAPVAITSVVSSCGCTDVKWTRTDIRPGATGKISATYKNEDGPYPFDKTLTVYVSGVRKPVILHLRGVVKDNLPASASAYPVHYGPLALRSGGIQAGNMSQGEKKSGEVAVSNIGKKPLSVTFKDVTGGLEVRLEPESIDPGATGKIRYTITSDRSRWGRNWYYATPVVNGSVCRSSGIPEPDPAPLGAQSIVRDDNPLLSEGSRVIGFCATTKEDFSSMSRTARENAAKPDFSVSTCSYGVIRVGTKVNATFRFRNSGGSQLRIYGIDSETSRVKVLSATREVEPGKEGYIRCSVDTSGLPKGERLFIISAYTNSPSRQIVYLYITGIVR